MNIHKPWTDKEKERLREWVKTAPRTFGCIECWPELANELGREIKAVRSMWYFLNKPPSKPKKDLITHIMARQPDYSNMRHRD